MKITETKIKINNQEIRGVTGSVLILSGWILFVLNVLFTLETGNENFIQQTAMINIIVGTILLLAIFVNGIFLEKEEKTDIGIIKPILFAVIVAASYANYIITFYAVTLPGIHSTMYGISWFLYLAGILMIFLTETIEIGRAFFQGIKKK